MYLHRHPYPPYIPERASKLIVGTIPPPRFSMGRLFETDVDFCYGSKYGLLWPILNHIFDLDLTFQNSIAAIEQRQNFLDSYGIGICDMVESCHRRKLDASDLGMEDITLRNIIQYLEENPLITTLLLMGGNSKNGPEFLLRSELRSQDIKLNSTSKVRPRIHQFELGNRLIKTVSLISPSSAANRSIGGDPYFKSQKSKNTNYSTFDFRIEQYRLFFT